MAEHRHKREPEARRPKPRPVAVIGPLAVLATAASVTLGVLAADPAATLDDSSLPVVQTFNCISSPSGVACGLKSWAWTLL